MLFYAGLQSDSLKGVKPLWAGRGAVRVFVQTPPFTGAGDCRRTRRQRQDASVGDGVLQHTEEPVLMASQLDWGKSLYFHWGSCAEGSFLQNVCISDAAERVSMHICLHCLLSLLGGGKTRRTTS